MTMSDSEGLLLINSHMIMLKAYIWADYNYGAQGEMPPVQIFDRFARLAPSWKFAKFVLYSLHVEIMHNHSELKLPGNQIT